MATNGYIYFRAIIKFECSVLNFVVKFCSLNKVSLQNFNKIGMGHKVNPRGFRLGIIENWNSRWFVNRKNAKKFLAEDIKLRDFLRGRLKEAGIINIVIERIMDDIHLIIKVAKPGIVIGRGGKGIDVLRAESENLIRKFRAANKIPLVFRLRLDVEEPKKNEVFAAIVARNIAVQLEKRLPFRRVVKKALEEASKNREAEGVKIKVGGRLDGAEISRSEWFHTGKIPLQTLRAHIDYAQDEAICVYGKVGIKVWIYKGEVFGDELL